MAQLVRLGNGRRFRIPEAAKHDGAGIVCAYHGLRFGAGERGDRIPSQPVTTIPAKLHLRTYPAVERYGLVWTCLAGDDGADADIPLKAIVESQQSECLPLDTSLGAHIMTDRSSIAYRRGPRDMGFSRFFTA